MQQRHGNGFRSNFMFNNTGGYPKLPCSAPSACMLPNSQAVTATKYGSQPKSTEYLPQSRTQNYSQPHSFSQTQHGSNPASQPTFTRPGTGGSRPLVLPGTASQQATTSWSQPSEDYLPRAAVPPGGSTVDDAGPCIRTVSAQNLYAPASQQQLVPDYMPCAQFPHASLSSMFSLLIAY